MESCSHAVDLERYETGPEVPVLLLSFDAELAAGASTGVIAGEPHVLDPMVSRSPWGTVTSVFSSANSECPHHLHCVGAEAF